MRTSPLILNNLSQLEAISNVIINPNHHQWKALTKFNWIRQWKFQIQKNLTISTHLPFHSISQTKIAMTAKEIPQYNHQIRAERQNLIGTQATLLLSSLKFCQKLTCRNTKETSEKTIHLSFRMITKKETYHLGHLWSNIRKTKIIIRKSLHSITMTLSQKWIFQIHRRILFS